MVRTSSLLLGALLVTCSLCSFIDSTDDKALLTTMLEAARVGNSRKLQSILASREVAKHILNQGDSEDGYSAMHWAAYGGHIASLQWLLIYGPDLEIRTRTLGSAYAGFDLARPSALMLACSLPYPCLARYSC